MAEHLRKEGALTNRGLKILLFIKKKSNWISVSQIATPDGLRI